MYGSICHMSTGPVTQAATSSSREVAGAVPDTAPLCRVMFEFNGKDTNCTYTE